VIDWRARNHPHGEVDPDLLTAAGMDIGSLLDDSGHLDMTRVDQFINETAARFRVVRRMLPNRAQGASGQVFVKTPSLSDIFRG